MHGPATRGDIAWGRYGENACFDELSPNEGAGRRVTKAKREIEAVSDQAPDVVAHVSLIQRVAGPFVCGVILALILRTIKRRARLIVFYGHVGHFRIQPTPSVSVPFGLHTHSVVIKNGGRLQAHNIRVPHALSFGLNAINAFVDQGINYTESVLPGGGDEILFPVMPVGQQVTIHHLYYPPLTWHQINLPINCDEGLARVVTVLPTVQLKRWQLWSSRALIVIGAISVLVGVVVAVEWGSAALQK
jgi:hypothetical protein